MKLSSAQAVGIGALMGGVATVGTSMLLRYFADNKGTAAAAGQPVTYPIWWEHSPLVGILGGAAATVLTYFLFGHSTEAAVACGMTSLIAGVAPEADGWVVESRAKADLEAATAAQSTPAEGARGLHGSADIIEMRQRIAALEAASEEYRAAA